MPRKTKTALAILTSSLMAFSAPVHAGQPDDPHARRDLIQANKDYQQSLNGPSGFGQRVSYKAKNKSGSDPFNNLGDYLKQMSK